MRFGFAAALALLSLNTIAAAQPTGAQALYVERRGLIEIDRRCAIVSGEIRPALEAAAAQAGGALLRAGWSSAELAELERATVAAAGARACTDARNAEAVRVAEAGFASWARTPAMTFSGAVRSWHARRYPNAAGWRLSQRIDAGVFGVRDANGAQRLTLALPLAPGQAAPASAQLIMRDPAKADAGVLDLRGRTQLVLAAGAPAAATAVRFFAQSRELGESTAGARYVLFVFPDAAFAHLTRLDPRESIVALAEGPGAAQRHAIEVGDIAAARAFLAIAPN